MSEQKEFDSMMTEEEILVMKHITTAEAPYSQRAQALLALNEGKTQEEAAEASGLRHTQVKYWAIRYRKNHLAVFPDELTAIEAEVIEKTEPEEAVKIVEAVKVEEVVVETAVPPKTSAPATKKDKKKSKKEIKADKKKKKGKKAKKGKKKTGNNKKKKKGKKEKSNKKK